jgi:integrase
VDALPKGATRDCLLAALLLGGQRLAQLARVTREDLNIADGESEATITLRDPKGARKQPRLHVLPVQGRALALFKRRLSVLDGAGAAAEAKTALTAARKPEPTDLAKRACGLLFSHDFRSSVRGETLSTAVAELSTTLLASKDVTAPFRLSDIRRTAETLLAGLGVSSDVRAQLQSHGLGGIQTRHYDRHSYMAEKRAALALWESQLYRRKVTNKSAVAKKRQRVKKP